MIIPQKKRVFYFAPSFDLSLLATSNNLLHTWSHKISALNSENFFTNNCLGAKINLIKLYLFIYYVFFRQDCKIVECKRFQRERT